MSTIEDGTLLWTPSAAFKEASQITAYLAWLRKNRNLDFAGYDDLWIWSVSEVEDFWASIFDYFAIGDSTSYQQVLDRRIMPGAKWFAGAN